MKTILAKYSGFCSGVERSAKFTQNNCYRRPIYTWGPLIHNDQFVNHLAKLGIKKTENFNTIKNATVIVRSHGIKKGDMKKIKNLAYEVIDGTCPNVTRVQNLASKLESEGNDIVIYGDPMHPEIIGIKSYVRKPYIISSISEIKLLPDFNKPIIISQTTQSIDGFTKISKKLKSRYPNLQIFNTICNATELRQNSAKSLSKKVDMMIVIGGKKSSNTKKLFEVCKKTVPTHLIETVHDLQKNLFKNINIVGVTAGASTPDWIIKEVLDYINKI